LDPLLGFQWPIFYSKKKRKEEETTVTDSSILLSPPLEFKKEKEQEERINSSIVEGRNGGFLVIRKELEDYPALVRGNRHFVGCLPFLCPTQISLSFPILNLNVFLLQENMN